MNGFIEQLNHWGEAVVPFAGQLLWQTSLLIVVLLSLDLILRNRARAGFRYALWMLLLVKLVLPPTVALPTGVGYWIDRSTKEPPEQQTVVVQTKFEVTYPTVVTTDATAFQSVQNIEPLPATESAPPPTPKLSRDAWLLIGSLTGTFLLLGWMLWRWRWVNRIVKASAPANGDLQQLAVDCIQTLSSSGDSVLPAACRQKDRRDSCPTLRLTDTAMSPAVCGLFRPIILLPRQLIERLSIEQLRTVLLHELIHLRRRDLWVNCVQSILQFVCWWHPLLWFANARIRRVREEAVDEAVASALRDDADAYPATLLEVAKLTFTRPLMTLGLVGILESKNALTQRIRRLLERQPLESTHLKWWQWTALVAFALAALPMAQGQNRSDDRSATTPRSGASIDQDGPSSNSVSTSSHAADQTNDEGFDAFKLYEKLYGKRIDRSKWESTNAEVRTTYLSNLFSEANTDLETREKSLRSLCAKLGYGELWKFDVTTIGSPFVERHLESLEPQEQALKESIKQRNIVRDWCHTVEMQLAQERINAELNKRHAPVDQREAASAISNQLASVELDLEHSISEYERLKKELGPDPSLKPEQTLSKSEFLRLLPVVQAGIKVTQHSNVLESLKLAVAKRSYGSLIEKIPNWPGWGIRQPSPPFSLKDTNLTAMGRQMITDQSPWPDPRFKGYHPIGLEPRFVLVPIEGLKKALNGQLPVAQPLIVASNQLDALTNSLIEAGAMDHSSAEPMRFGKMSGGVFLWSVASNEISRVQFETTKGGSTNDIVFGARQGMRAYTPDWSQLTLLARPFIATDDSLHCLLSFATGAFDPLNLAKTESDIPLGAVLLWASTNAVRPGFAQAMLLKNTGSPTLEDTNNPDAPSADQPSKLKTQIENAKLFREMGKLDEAEHLLRELLKENPESREIQYHLDLVQRDRNATAATESEAVIPRRSLKGVRGGPLPGDRMPLPRPNPYATRPPQLNDSPGRQAIMEKLNKITLDKLIYEAVPLNEVVRTLSDETRRLDPEGTGINFMIVSHTNAPIVNGQPPTAVENAADKVEDIGSTIIDINPPLTNIRLIDALDAICMAADRPIEFTVDGFAVVFKPKAPSAMHLETRTFRVDPDTFYQGMENASGSSVERTTNHPLVGPGVRFLARTNDLSVVNIAARDYFEAAGVKLEPPKMLYFNDRTGMLLVKATPEDLSKIQRAVETLNRTPATLSVEARILKMSPSVWSELVKLDGLRDASGGQTNFVFDGSSDTLQKWLDAHPGIQTLFGPKVTTLEHRPTTLSMRPAINYPDQLQSGFELNFNAWRDTNTTSQIWIEADAVATVAGKITQNGDIVPVTPEEMQAPVHRENGAVYSVNAVGYLKRKIKTDGIRIPDGHWAILGGPQGGLSGGTAPQTNGLVVIALIKPTVIDPAGD